MKSGFVSTGDGVRLHYLEAGAGDALLFVPGFTMPAEIWQGQLEFFAAGHRVVALDPRSHGASDRPGQGHYPERLAADLHDVIEGLGLSPAVMISWAFAVPQALTYIARYGTSQLRALVLVDGFVGRETTLEEAMGYLRWLHSLQADRAKAAAEFVRGDYVRPQPAEYLERITAATLRVPSDTAVALSVGFLTRLDQSAALATVDVPLMYIATEAKRDQAELVRRHAPAARVEMIAEAGHAVFVDQPEQFNGRLAEFLAGVKGAEGGPVV
jgi:microsomal epoxide hydrolase